MKHTKEKKKRTTISIKAKVSLLCAIFILIATSINFLVISNVSKKTISSNTATTMKSLASAYSEKLSSAISSITESSNFLMQSQVLSSFLDSDGTRKTEDLENYLSMFLATNSNHEDISLVSKDGIILYSTNNALLNKDISNESYFINTINTGKSSQGNVFISDTSGNACITFSIPIRENITRNTPNKNELSNIATDDVTPEGSDLSNNEETTTSNDVVIAQGNTAPEENIIGVLAVTVQVSVLNDVLSNISFSDNESGYAYLLDSNGTVIYHPDESLIGTSLSIDSINKLVANISDGTYEESGTMAYTYNNKEIYSGYQIDSNNHWILVLATSKREVFSSLNDVTSTSLFCTLILTLVLTIVSYIFASTITRPIKKLTAYIQKTANLDFTKDDSFALLSNVRDETGEMSVAIEKMRRKILTMLIEMNEASEQILTSANQLSTISKSVNDNASDTSAIAEELSAGMEEAAATTDMICENVANIEHQAKKMKEITQNGMELSSKLTEQAMNLASVTTKSVEDTKKIYNQVRSQANEAISKAQAVEKINTMTAIIRDIASQTSMLSLNASIEAARAGEAGRGFSIVASEIGHLANQSTNTVSNINTIIDEVNLAVKSLTDCLEQTLEFLEEKVLSDYQEFLVTSEQYNKDATKINQVLDGINQGIYSLNEDLSHINTSIVEINAMVNDSSQAVNEVAVKNTDIVGQASETHNKANDNRNFATTLKDMVNKFKF